MNPVWLIPVLALLVGGVAVVALLRGAAEEVRLLVDELGRNREVGRTLRALSDDVHGANLALDRTTRTVRGRR